MSVAPALKPNKFFDRLRLQTLKPKRDKNQSILKYGYLFRFFRWIGIDLYEHSDSPVRHNLKQIAFGCIPLILHLAYLDNLVMTTITLLSYKEHLLLLIPYAFRDSLTLLLWHIMRRKNKQLRKLLDFFEENLETVITSTQKFTFNIILIIICILPIPYSLLSANNMLKEPRSTFYTYFTYGLELEYSSTLFIYLIVKSFTYTVLNPTLSCIFALLYCVMCYQSYKMLSDFRIHRLSYIITSNGQALDMLKNYANILEALTLTQRVFSLPSFIMILTEAISSFIYLALILIYGMGILKDAWLIEALYACTTCSLSLIIIMIMASQVPIEMEKTKVLLHKLYEKLLWLYAEDPQFNQVLHFLNSLLDRPVVIFSAYESVFFTRNLILSGIGNFFTYSLLLMQVNNALLPSNHSVSNQNI